MNLTRIIIVLFAFFILSSLGFSSLSYGQGIQTSGGVDVDGSWYLGEGLKEGDYFEYSLCEIDLNDCAPIKLKMWIKGDIQHETETLWDTKVVIIDANKIIKGSMGLGKIVPEPITFDDDLFDYAIAFKSSLAWLSTFATGNENDRIHGPQEFRSISWGKLGPIIGGSNAQLITDRVETITTPAGTLDTIVVGWYSGNDNEIWIVDDFPFPVKALTYVGIIKSNVPIMYQFTLLNYKENVMIDPFQDVEETIPKEKLLGCQTEFFDYVSGRVSTNTYSMMIQYNYSPEIPIEGCNIDWRINFLNIYHDIEILDKVHYDILIVDEEGNKLRSYAEDLGQDNLFNAFGQAHILLPIEEKAGLVRYSIFVYGIGLEQEQPDVSKSGFAIVEIQINENPLLEKLNDDIISTTKIPNWIKNNAGWWANGQIDDNSFINGIQFLIKEKIMDIPDLPEQSSKTTEEKVPDWIKNNAGWWADGVISEDEFVNGIKYLIEKGIVSVT